MVIVLRESLPCSYPAKTSSTAVFNADLNAPLEWKGPHKMNQRHRNRRMLLVGPEAATKWAILVLCTLHILVSFRCPNNANGVCLRIPVLMIQHWSPRP